MAAQNENKHSDKEKLTRRKRKTRKISFRLLESEYAQISDDIAVCGLTVSSLARKRLLGVSVASRADLAVLSELRRLGGLLKHIHNETRGIYSSLTAQAIKDLSAYARELTAKRRAAPPEKKTRDRHNRRLQARRAWQLRGLNRLLRKRRTGGIYRNAKHSLSGVSGFGNGVAGVQKFTL
jgi:ribosomal protein S25